MRYAFGTRAELERPFFLACALLRHRLVIQRAAYLLAGRPVWGRDELRALLRTLAAEADADERQALDSFCRLVGAGQPLAEDAHKDALREADARWERQRDPRATGPGH